MSGIYVIDGKANPMHLQYAGDDVLHEYGTHPMQVGMLPRRYSEVGIAKLCQRHNIDDVYIMTMSHGETRVLCRDERTADRLERAIRGTKED